MYSRTRASRYAVSFDPALFERFRQEEGAWYESAEEITQARWNALERAALMRWVHHQMGRRLTNAERRGVELYYLRDLSYRQAAEAEGTNPANVYRNVRRAIRKLRAAAQEDPPAVPRKRRFTA